MEESTGTEITIQSLRDELEDKAKIIREHRSLLLQQNRHCRQMEADIKHLASFTLALLALFSVVILYIYNVR